jgi:tetratricopeptide (TPR) repeat protein
MSDPTSSGNPLSFLSQATDILAAHGVYALTAIFIFYQQHRAYTAMNKATAPEDHAFFRKVYTSVVAATYVLMVLSTAIWFYANFVFSREVYIKGTLMGLTENLTAPSSEKEKPEIVQSIMPASAVDLYENRKLTEGTTLDGKYDLGWILVSKEPDKKLTKLVFRFQQHYEVWQPAAASANPFESHPTSQRLVDTVPGVFRLDLGSIHYSPGRSIQLMYEPDASDMVRKIGKMYLLLEDKRVPLDWQDASSVTHAAAPPAGPVTSGLSSLSHLFKVYAAGRAGENFFTANGDYNPQAAALLRERLGSTNLGLEQESVDFLVREGSRSFKFIADSLKAQSTGNFDEGLLKHNLGTAVDRLDAKGIHAPPELSLQLAVTFYMNQDYKSAARFFDRAGDNAIHDDENLYFKGYAHYQTGQYDQAVRDYERYLKTPHKSQYDAVARTTMGSALRRAGRDQEAIEQYKHAIKLNPKYALAYNNLAYVYALRGENLSEALDLVNTAMRLETDEVNLAEEKDTKGWILFKSGKPGDALPLIREAAAKLLTDKEVQDDLSVVQKTLPGQAK